MAMTASTKIKAEYVKVAAVRWDFGAAFLLPLWLDGLEVFFWLLAWVVAPSVPEVGVVWVGVVVLVVALVWPVVEVLVFEVEPDPAGVGVGVGAGVGAGVVSV